MLWIKQKELNTNFVALVEILQDQDSNSNLHSSIVIIFALQSKSYLQISKKMD